jgi:leucyl aminopeptidase
MTNPIKISLIQELPKKPGMVILPILQDASFVSEWMNHLPEGFSGKRGELLHTYDSHNQQTVILLGLGADQESPLIFEVFRKFVAQNQNRLANDVLVDFRHLSDSLIYHCVLGLSLSNYQVGAYKTTEKTNATRSFILLLSNTSDQYDADVNEAIHTAEAIKNTCSLVDAPGNIKTPRYLGEMAVKAGEAHDFEVHILDHQTLVDENMHALLAVGQGSQHPPLLIKAIYRHPDLDPSKIDLGLVGKGVTFDTGGLSLKKPTNMHYMKSDMGGAAAVLGALELIARLQLKLNVVAVIPVAENSVDALSIRPGDVIQSHAGKSIEVIDTDAEGRLILADALSYIQEHYQPMTLLDLATLTGSCVAALGYEAAGLFTKDSSLAEAISGIGDQVGERVWRLPLWDGYKDALESDVADVKNLSGKPVAGAITAAKFLEYFVKEDQKWAHLDIAGVAFGETEHAKMKSATGYGVRLLAAFARALIVNEP